ncbi:hypothetical protein ACFHW2_21440 [Actinomadura sp. LOL_016]|uniref:hypothetical protein n=1 Tax=unclassified Actinomadura TaxID=2626254 RepID=UPI003A8078E8
MRNANAISGGVGWDDYRGALRWSADSTLLAAAYNTNVIGVWNPFDRYAYPIASASHTDGASRPPQFGFGPDGRSVWVDTPTDGVVPGAIANVERGHVTCHPGHRKRLYGGDFTTSPRTPPSTSPKPCRAHHWATEVPADRALDGAEVWSLADEPERTTVLDTFEDTCGVLWGAGEVIVLIGPETVRFTRPDGTATTTATTSTSTRPAPRRADLRGRLRLRRPGHRPGRPGVRRGRQGGLEGRPPLLAAPLGHHDLRHRHTRRT